MLEAIKYLSESIEEITEKAKCEKNNVKDILESQEITDPIIVKNADDIKLIKNAKDENKAAIKELDNRIYAINEELKTVKDKLEDKDISKEKSRIEKATKRTKCKMCDTNFHIFSDLENHIKNCHNIHKGYKCDKCEKDFVLMWRLKKHMNIHRDKFYLQCHYFNNGKECPFEELGCKFLHTVSRSCKFGLECSKIMCPFRHPKVTVGNEDATDIQENENVEKDIIENEKIEINKMDNIVMENDFMADNDFFLTSTPEKRQFECRQCQNKTQCVDCYVREDNFDKGENDQDNF